jgi:periplasmic divalent cation tolerance protein
VSDSQAARVIFCTCPDADFGAELAGKLVESRLAACVNLIDSVRSIYRWEGKLCDDREVLLVIKTTEPHVVALTEMLAELHPYDCPEVIALPVTSGHAPYLDWLAAQVG